MTLRLCSAAILLGACASALFTSACGNGADDAQLSQPARRGKAAYVNCVSCHGPDPTRDGPQGPAVAGASRALLEARVMRGAYPDGYKPKRSTAIMPPQPILQPYLDDLAAYLAEVGQRAKQRG